MNNPLRFFLLLIVILSACAPAPMPSPTSTPDGFTSSSVEVVDKFYKTINDAQTKEGLLAAYYMFTNEALCSPKVAANCDNSRFLDRWWQVKVTYKLYDCGDNAVIAEEARYPRDSSISATPAAPKFSRFQLQQTDDGLLINDISPTQAPGDSCVFVVELKN